MLAAGLIVSVLVFATGDSRLTVTGYSDVIRFQADGVATLQVRIFDLSGKVVWDSSVVSGNTIDWNRNNDFGERLAYGAYIYSAQGWSAQGGLDLQKNGKLALMPGDKVQLQAAPTVASSSGQEDTLPSSDASLPLHPMAVDVDHSTESWAFAQVGIGTTSPSRALEVHGASGVDTRIKMSTINEDLGIEMFDGATFKGGFLYDYLMNVTSFYGTAGTGGMIDLRSDGSITFRNGADAESARIDSTGKLGIGTTSPSRALEVHGASGVDTRIKMSTINEDLGIEMFDGATFKGGFLYDYLMNVTSFYGTAGTGGMIDLRSDGSITFRNGADAESARIDSTGKLGIGTTSPSATLEVHGSATNLLALYDPVAPIDPKFRVEKTGTVRADGAYYSGTGGFHTGSADVAERINTSEWVEPGNVVEIDPEHPGFFRKSSSPYSRKVAGIISTSPGVILGNSFDEATDDWEDNRPVLAVTGRVPCKVTAENGAIKIGDLLVASSTPGVAMKGNPEESMGAVVGKAMEPLEEGMGTIVVQVMLR